MTFVESIDFSTLGSIPNVNSYEVAVHNSKTFEKALQLVSSYFEADKTVYIPSVTYYFANSTVYNLQGVNIHIDGEIRFSDQIDRYTPDGSGRWSLWYFFGCEDISIYGNWNLI